MTPTGLPYRPPNPGTLLDSPVRTWDYQTSPELLTVLRDEIEKHFNHYINRHINKTTIPLYLFLSGAGTGKSRNASELHNSAYRCFDGTFSGKRKDDLAQWLKDPFVFHVTFENGTSIQTEELDPWRAIGSRMLLQVLRGNEVKPEDKMTIGYINFMWDPPTPDDVINLLAKKGFLEKRAVFLIVDGLHNISDVFGETCMFQILTQLGGLAHRKTSQQDRPVYDSVRIIIMVRPL